MPTVHMGWLSETSGIIGHLIGDLEKASNRTIGGKNIPNWDAKGSVINMCEGQQRNQCAWRRVSQGEKGER